MTYEASEDETTTFIVPAPLEAYQEAGVAWYEAQVSTEAKRLDLVAYTTDAKEVGRADVRLVGDLEARATISGQQAELSIDLSPGTAQDDTLVQGQINGQVFTIPASGGQSNVSPSYPEVTFTAAESQLLRQWSGIGHSLTMMAHAMAGGRDRSSCAGCVVHGAGEVVLAVACADGALPACGALLVTWPNFVDHCTGACA